MVRITRVYTKSGDAGETSLVDGSRVSKADPRVVAYGDVDELNSWLGLVRTRLNDEELDQELGRIQNELFIIGADLASPLTIEVPRIREEQVAQLEGLIDRLLEDLEELREFILPGGSEAAGSLHIARTIARRAERQVVAIAAEINPQTLIYLNRLSDLLFVMARTANKRAGVKDISADFSSRGR
ncbi:MAG: cob(I)yrinic acid a,c-diamide adenosyltransferase [Acidobacteriota bacterium]|nr:MAG: cob(I)yrinic acid a,c-diamide adenosyltransferase [Acidobacteriota bacterium]